MRQVGKPFVYVIRRQVAELTCAKSGDDVRVRQDGALGDGVRVASAQAEGEPVVNGVSHGVPVAFDDESVLVLTDEFLDLLPIVRIEKFK